MRRDLSLPSSTHLTHHRPSSPDGPRIHLDIPLPHDCAALSTPGLHHYSPPRLPGYDESQHSDLTCAHDQTSSKLPAGVCTRSLPSNAIADAGLPRSPINDCPCPALSAAVVKRQHGQQLVQRQPPAFAARRRAACQLIHLGHATTSRRGTSAAILGASHDTGLFWTKWSREQRRPLVSEPRAGQRSATDA